MVRNYHESPLSNTLDSKGHRGNPSTPFSRPQNFSHANNYEVPPRFRRQLANAPRHANTKSENRLGNRSNTSSTSPPQLRRKTGRSPINFEDFLPIEHRSSPASKLSADSSEKDDSGVELTDDVQSEISVESSQGKFETPPRFQKPSTGLKEQRDTVQEGVVTASGKFVAVGRKPHKAPKNRVNGARPVGILQHALMATAGGGVPVLLPGPPGPGAFFTGPPALQFYHQNAVPAYVAYPGMEMYDPALVPNEQQLAAMYGLVPEYMREFQGAPMKQKAPKEAKKPMKSSENFKYVYVPPPDEPAQEYATGTDAETVQEFKFPNRRNKEQKENESGVMDFSWEKFLSEIGKAGEATNTSASFLSDVADDSSASSMSGTATPESGTASPESASPGLTIAEPANEPETLAVPVFAKSPPASEVPLPPIDWLTC